MLPLSYFLRTFRRQTQNNPLSRVIPPSKNSISPSVAVTAGDKTTQDTRSLTVNEAIYSKHLQQSFEIILLNKFKSISCRCNSANSSPRQVKLAHWIMFWAKTEHSCKKCPDVAYQNARLSTTDASVASPKDWTQNSLSYDPKHGFLPSARDMSLKIRLPASPLGSKNPRGVSEGRQWTQTDRQTDRGKRARWRRWNYCGNVEREAEASRFSLQVWVNSEGKMEAKICCTQQAKSWLCVFLNLLHSWWKNV